MKNPYICDVTKDEMLHHVNSLLSAWYGAGTVAGSKVRGLRKAQLTVVYQTVYLWRDDEISDRIKVYEDVVKELVG